MLPTLYIFASKEENSENFGIEPSLVEGLPTITRNFGRNKKFYFHSSVAVLKKVSMDGSLFQIYVDIIVLSTYNNALITIKQDYIKGQLLKGVFFLNLQWYWKAVKSRRQR